MNYRKNTILILLMSFISFSVGCGSFSRWTSPPKIPTINWNDSEQADSKQLQRDVHSLDVQNSDSKEIRFENVSLDEFVAVLNREFLEFTVVYDNSIELKPITGLFSGSLGDMLSDFAITNNLILERFKNKYYLIKNKSDLSKFQDSFSFENTIPQEELEKLRSRFNIEILTNGSLAVAIGRVDDLKQFDYIYSLLRDKKQSYEIKLVFVRLTSEDLAKVQAELQVKDFDLIARKYDFLTAFSADLQVDFEDSKVYDYTTQTIYATDGKQSNIKIGTEINRETMSMSEMGVSAVSGYQNFNDGIEFQITPRRLDGSNVELKIEFTKSKFNEGTDLSKSQVDLNYEGIQLQTLKPYYLTSYNDGSNSFNNVLLGGRKLSSDQKIAVWVQVKPVI